MQFEIIHRTYYNYSHPVSLEPFILRLRPRCDANQTLRSYRIDITPAPGGISHCVELDGNNTETVWFGGLYENLLIEAESLVEKHNTDLFNFIVTDMAALKLPFRYEPHLASALAPYLLCDDRSLPVESFAKEVMAAANHETLPFLTLLASRIYDQLSYLLREHGEPWTAAETLRQGQGSCRDFAVLFIESCRVSGIAARFVSGYCIGDAAADNHMHAWAEVYLPGAGWRGFDPSRGLSISEDYIAVAAGHSPQNAAPTLGHYRGDASSTMEALISIKLLHDDTAGITRQTD